MAEEQKRVLIIGGSTVSRASVRAAFERAQVPFALHEGNGAVRDEESYDLIVALAPVDESGLAGASVPVIAVGETAVVRPAARLPLAPEQLGHLPWLARALLAESMARRERAARRMAVRKAAQFAEQTRYLRRLNDITRAAVHAPAFEDTVSILAERLVELINADGCYITLWDSEREQALPAAASGVHHEGYTMVVAVPGEPTITESVLRSGEILVIDDVPRSPHVSPRLKKRYPMASALGLPLIVDGTKLGAVIIAFQTPHAFTEVEIARCREASEHIGVTVAKTHWLSRERERRELAETMREVAGALSTTLDRAQVLDLILTQLARVLRYDSASVMLIEGDALVNVSRRSRHHSSGKSRRMPLGRYSHLREVVEGRQTVIIGDTMDDPRWQKLDGIDTIRCWLGAPLIVEGEVIGLLNLTRSQPHFYGQSAAEITKLFADQAAVAIRNARLFEEAQARVRALNLLNHIIGVASEKWEAEDTLLSGCEALREYFGSGRAIAALLDDTGDEQRIVAIAGDVDGHYRRGQAIGPERWPELDEVMTAGQTAVVSVGEEGETAVTSLSVPILVRDRVVGTVRVEFNSPRPIDAEMRRLAQTVGEELGRGLETSRLYAYLQQHAAELEDRVQERTRELAAANERLTELDRLKSQFIADMSHELRTPVSNLHLYLSLLGKGKPEKRAHYETVLRSQADRLEQLIESILDMLRLERDPADVDFQSVSLNEVARKVVADQQERARVAGLELSYSPAPDDPQVMGDVRNLQRLLTNLLANALEFTSSGWVRVAVEGGVSGSRLTVADSGPGIAAIDRPHIFERFYRGQQAAQMNIPGMGLGLHLVQEIASRHGGRIELESEEEQGTTVRVWFPRPDTE